MRTTRTTSFFILVLSGIILSGCSFVRIQNVSDASVRVRVRVPDSGTSYSRHIRPGRVEEFFSSHGGRYSVELVPTESYIDSLNSLQEIITQRLFTEGQTLSAAEVARLVENLNQIDQLLAEAAEPGASCSGNVPDFDTSVVVVIYDPMAASYQLSCSSGG